jgi:RimJ/RimL family protein N-acetyltransferase
MGSRDEPAERPAPVEHPLLFETVSTTLRDGTPILVRPIRPDDRGRLAEGFRRLSPESRYRRFLTVAEELTADELRYLTEIDYRNHFAWVAVREDRPEEGLGVARWVRLRDEPDVAEPGITVVDDYQGRGLGTLLLGLLAAAARAGGIARFRAYVLEENEPMRALLEQLGATVRHDSPGLLTIEVPLDPGVVPDTPAGRVLRAAAEQVVRLVPPRATQP